MTMKIIITHIIVALLLCIASASAQKYHLLQTVTGTGGGGQSSSSSYSMGNTVGALGNGHNASSGYTGEGGFWGEHEALSEFHSSSFVMAGGWNLISVGRLTPDYRTMALFPTATSKAFAFAGSYVTHDTLKHGQGFWLKFPSNQVVNVPGIPLSQDTIPVVVGWNMIGSIGSPVSIGSVVKIPGGMTTSSYFGYNGSYQIVSNIDPGKGHWVKCSVAGTLVLTATGAAPAAVPIAGQQGSEVSLELNVLTVTPKTEGANQPSQTLLFASAIPEGKTPESYVMPPQAPGGPDARFATNRYAEFFNGGENERKEIPLSIRSDGGAVTLSWTLNERAGQKYVLVEKQGEKIVAEHRLTSNGNVTLTDIEKKKLTLKLENMPLAYALAQNYPNPFNPTTVIRYQVPIKGHVTLKIYDIIGKELATVFDGEQIAGYQSVEWNATNIASGVYFYRMTAGKFSEVKKMMLIK